MVEQRSNFVRARPNQNGNTMCIGFLGVLIGTDYMLENFQRAYSYKKVVITFTFVEVIWKLADEVWICNILKNDTKN